MALRNYLPQRCVCLQFLTYLYHPRRPISTRQLYVDRGRNLPVDAVSSCDGPHVGDDSGPTNVALIKLER
jgi:hypothetical protein